MKFPWLACLVTSAAALVNARGQTGCESKLQNCTDLVKPFLNDLRYMFPTTIEDVDDMCKMWSRFVDCIRRYVTDCATEDQRSKFNNAVGDSIDTVHAICSSERYQRGVCACLTTWGIARLIGCGERGGVYWPIRTIGSLYRPIPAGRRCL